MSEFEEIMANIRLLNAADKARREKARKAIREMGVEAIPYLNRARGNVIQFPYIEVFQMIADIGDDLFASGGVDAIDSSILNTMEYGSKIRKDSQYAPLVVKDIAIQALTRWGVPIPSPPVDPVRHCHICNKSNQEVGVQTCFLPDCQNAVCEAHAAILESGKSTIWFCSSEHKHYANHHPEVMM